jgi:hypothetical protein
MLLRTLYSRPGNDFTRRFLLIIDAIARLRAASAVSSRILPTLRTWFAPLVGGLPKHHRQGNA